MYVYVHIFRSKSYTVVPEHRYNIVQERRKEFNIMKRKTVNDKDPVSVLRKEKDRR